jgi:hypothetical protein
VRPYKEFAELLKRYPELIIQAFPSSEFGGQEFAKNEDIAAFVAARGFVGPNAMLMDKVKVNGSSSSPVFKFLKNRVGQVLPIKWNFDGKVRQSAVSPSDPPLTYFYAHSSVSVPGPQGRHDRDSLWLHTVPTVVRGRHQGGFERVIRQEAGLGSRRSPYDGLPRAGLTSAKA